MISNRNIGAVLGKVRVHNKQYPVPAVTLVAKNHHSAFHVLISTLISLRTRDQVTSQAAARLFAAAYTPEAIAALPEKRIAELIYPALYYNNKAKAIKEAARTIIEKYGGSVPDTVEELTTIDGVGRKTANLVVTLGHGKLGICVDTHVHRISNRWGYVETRNPDATEQALRGKLPNKYWIEYNDLLVTFGQNHCTPIGPKCSACPLKAECPKRNVTTRR